VYFGDRGQILFNVLSSSIPKRRHFQIVVRPQIIQDFSVSYFCKAENGWEVRRGFLLLMLISVAGIAIFYLVENTRGHLALEKARTEYLAAGYRLDLNEILGPEVPDEENFAATHFIELAYRGGSRDPEAWFGHEPLPPLVGSIEASPNPSSHPIAPLAIYFHEPLSEYESAEKLKLLLLSRNEDLLRFHQDLELLKCDWRIVMDVSDFSTQLQHLGLWREAHQSFQLNAQINIELGEERQAAKWIIAMCDLHKHMTTSQNLISKVIGLSMLKKSQDQILHGIEKRIWSKNSARKLRRKLDEASQKVTWQETMEQENAIAYQVVQTPGKYRNGIAQSQDLEYLRPWITIPNTLLGYDLPSLDSLERRVSRVAIYLIPKGWMDASFANQLYETISPDSPATIHPDPLASFFESGYEMEAMHNRVQKTQVISQLTKLALEAQYSFSTDGEYPTRLRLADSPNYGYQLGENGRPVIWYSESGPAEETLDPNDYELIPREYLLRFP